MNETLMKVLLVEDNPGDARLIREMIAEVKGTQFDLHCTERLSAALECLAEGDIALILTDLELLDSQGLETFAKVYGQAPQVPIIVLTGLDDEEAGLEAVRRGAQDYLVKGHIEGNLLVRAMRYAIERKRAQEQLKEYSENLERMVDERTQELKAAYEKLIRTEKLAAMGELAGGVGHDLRSPLTTIRNSAYLLKMIMEEAVDEKVAKYLDMIEEQVDVCDKIISDLLDSSRLGKIEVKEVDINQIVHKVVQATVPPQNVEISTSLAPDLTSVMADASQLEQIFPNLIANAIQAMPDGGTLSLSTDQKENFIEVRVADTGAGIPDENLDKVFEPLFTTKAKGVGLGLAIVKRLVERQSGVIQVESQVGKGTTFTVKLPIANARTVVSR